MTTTTSSRTNPKGMALITVGPDDALRFGEGVVTLFMQEVVGTFDVLNSAIKTRHADGDTCYTQRGIDLFRTLDDIRKALVANNDWYKANDDLDRLRLNIFNWNL